MQKTTSLSSIAIMAVLFLFVVGCGEQPSPAAGPTATDEPAIQTAEAKLGRATPLPVPREIGTLPPAPGASPTAGTISGRIFADQLGIEFKNAQLEFVQPTRMTPKDYGLAPLLCSGTHFLIPSLCSDCGGRIYECETTEDRDRLAKFYNEAAKGSAILFSWVFARKNIVIQINGDLPEAKARKYQAVLEAMQ